MSNQVTIEGIIKHTASMSDAEVTELGVLAFEIAHESAVSDIELLETVYREGIAWQQVALASADWRPFIDKRVEFLKLLGMLEHHPEEQDLVRLIGCEPDVHTVQTSTPA